MRALAGGSRRRPYVSRNEVASLNYRYGDRSLQVSFLPNIQGTTSLACPCGGSRRRPYVSRNKAASLNYISYRLIRGSITTDLFLPNIRRARHPWRALAGGSRRRPYVSRNKAASLYYISYRSIRGSITTELYFAKQSHKKERPHHVCFVTVPSFLIFHS